MGEERLHEQNALSTSHPFLAGNKSHTVLDKETLGTIISACNSASLDIIMITVKLFKRAETRVRSNGCDASERLHAHRLWKMLGANRTDGCFYSTSRFLSFKFPNLAQLVRLLVSVHSPRCSTVRHAKREHSNRN